MPDARRTCLIIPTYNNAGTVAHVVADVLAYGLPVLVVNDGSTDATEACLAPFADAITLLSYMPNKGKGYALEQGFKRARAMGFDYALTLDSDGQHFATDIPLFLEALQAHPGNTLVIGSRLLTQENMPRKNTFANRFSNFWYAVQTAHRLPDTQTGYRLYPLYKMKRMHCLTARYEAELELLVRLTWRGTRPVPIPIQVYYAPEGERVTHFRKGRDFLRISLLNTVLCIVAILYGYPAMGLNKIGTWINS